MRDTDVYGIPSLLDTDFIECGNTNTAGFAGLEASIDLIAQIGVPAIFAHVNRYLDALEAGLVERGFESLRAKDPAQRSAILSALPPAGISVVNLQRALGGHGISCSIPDGLLRFSPHWPNALDEIGDVLSAIDASCAGP